MVEPEKALAVIRTIASLLDPRVPFVRLDRRSPRRAQLSILGCPVLGTNLVLCFTPLEDEFFFVSGRCNS